MEDFYDWQKTQNDSYLKLLNERLNEVKLRWVNQFINLINSRYFKNHIRINDVGCNVGHFPKFINLIKSQKVEYNGYDISKTYLDIAKRNFGNKNIRFSLKDISKSKPARCDVTVMSSTLEHIYQHENALKNIFQTTDKIFILRTFYGNEYLEDMCLTNGADDPYVIKQFKTTYLKATAKLYSFETDTLDDEATKGSSKFVCNFQTISRRQKVFYFEKKEVR